MADIDLIHAGLPWNNPQKITVKADQYISQLVINRGLLNLLSNDYYLDLKTQRINQYIVQLLGPHIADMTIHWTEAGIIDIIKRFLNGELGNYLDSFGLLKDTAFIIPVDPEEDFPKNVNRIQNIINNCPKNLNGHTAIFALTPVVSGNFNTTIGQYYVNNADTINDPSYSSSSDIATSGCYLDSTNVIVNHKAIMMNGFYGGTIVLLGNDFFTCEPKYRDGGKSLNTRQTRILLEQIQKNVDKTPLKKISFTGNGENNTRSVVSFNNCNCDSYLWNVGITLDSSIQSSDDTNSDTPKKRDLAFYFPANLVDDIVTGYNRYVVADTLNDQNFSETYLTLRSTNQLISGAEVEGIDYINQTDRETISAVQLNGDYLMLSSAYGSFIQTFFGQYIGDEVIQKDSLYEGATFCFWMKDNFYDNNVNEVPVLYSVDSNGDGYYFGLDKVANIYHNQVDVTQYLDTTFASKRRTDLNGGWNFWAIQIEPQDLNLNTYLVSAFYYNPEVGELLPILPSKTTVASASIGGNYIPKNQITIPYLNFSYPISFFGTPDIRLSSYVRNITLFNSVVTEAQLKALAAQKLVNAYNLSEVDSSQTFKNGMKGALYVYNTTSMNVIGCDLKKKKTNDDEVGS